MSECDYCDVFNYMMNVTGELLYLITFEFTFCTDNDCNFSCHAYVLTLIEVGLFKVLVAFNKFASKIKEQQ
jgi:hypothetical protein